MNQQARSQEVLGFFLVALLLGFLPACGPGNIDNGSEWSPAAGGPAVVESVIPVVQEFEVLSGTAFIEALDREIVPLNASAPGLGDLVVFAKRNPKDPVQVQWISLEGDSQVFEGFEAEAMELVVPRSWILAQGPGRIVFSLPGVKGGPQLALSVEEVVVACDARCPAGDYTCLLESQMPCLTSPWQDAAVMDSQVGLEPDEVLAAYSQRLAGVQVAVSEDPADAGRLLIAIAPSGSSSEPAVDASARFAYVGSEAIEEVQAQELNEVAYAMGEVARYSVPERASEEDPPLLLIDRNEADQEMDPTKVIFVSLRSNGVTTRSGGTMGVKGRLRLDTDSAVVSSGRFWDLYGINDDLAGVEVWFNSACKLAGVWVFNPWDSKKTSTAADGTFAVSKSVSFKNWDRKLALKVRFGNSQVLVGRKRLWSPPAELVPGLSTFYLDVEPYHHQVYSSARVVDIGTHTFVHQREGTSSLVARTAAVYYYAKSLYDTLKAHNLGFQRKVTSNVTYWQDVVINYPMLFDMTAYASPLSHVVQLNDDDADWATTAHELFHIWHYQHNKGWFWNLPEEMIDGWSSHNCQEDPNIAFLEGIAEAMNAPLFCATFPGLAAPALCDMRNGLLHPSQFNATCEEEEEGLADTEHRFIRRDDAVEHALGLLMIAPEQLIREQVTTAGNRIRPNLFEANVATRCQNYQAPAATWQQVMRTFYPDSQHGYGDHWPSGADDGLDRFLTRFSKIHGFDSAWMNYRKDFWWFDVGDATPHDVCLADESLTRCHTNARTFDGVNCYYGWPPANTTAFFQNGRFYYTATNGSCAATSAWPNAQFDGVGCLVTCYPTDAEPFVWNNAWYTKPYLGTSATSDCQAPSGY